MKVRIMEEIRQRRQLHAARRMRIVRLWIGPDLESSRPRWVIIEHFVDQRVRSGDPRVRDERKRKKTRTRMPRTWIAREAIRIPA